MQVSDLQAWARCKCCGLVIWTEVSPDEQACACSCGDPIKICQNFVCGNKDETFTEEEMQAVLDAEYGN